MSRRFEVEIYVTSIPCRDCRAAPGDHCSKVPDEIIDGKRVRHLMTNIGRGNRAHCIRIDDAKVSSRIVDEALNTAAGSILRRLNEEADR